MQPRTPIFIVTSPRPRVGKTLLARALIEYFCAQKRPVAGFDVNPDDFGMVEFLPAFTAVATIGDIRGQMALFDQLVMPDQMPKVVDLGDAQFDAFFALVQQIDFLEEARRRGIMPMVLFIADPDRRARQGYAVLSERFPDLALVPAFNEVVPQIARHRDSFPPTRCGGTPVTIPALAPVIRSVIERPNFSFISYASKAPDTTSELYDWTRKVFLTFRELELRLLLDELRPRLAPA